MGEVLKGRYELLEVAGAGGEGTVMRSLDRQHDRIVALKIRPTAAVHSREEMLAEARLLLAVPPHPNLPLVREDFFDGDRYVIAMDWVQGTDLGALIRAEGRPGLPVPSVMRWLAEAAEALAHLHAQVPHVVHGDVKPANLILGEDGRLRLVDFGLSSSPATRGRRGGTPGYVAPELTAGAMPTIASDVYALAATAWALLTGGPPTGVRPSWDGVGAAEAAHLEDAIRSGLATDPARRPATPGELVERIRAGWRSDLPTGVLTFCLTDVVESTARWSSDPEAMARALVHHDGLLADVAHRHGGQLLKSMGEGDATVSVFASAAAAVEAAAAAHRALAAAEWPGGVPLHVRIGVHTGPAEQRGGDYFGVTLSVAARLRSEASAGEVLLSGATAALVRSALPQEWGLVDLGPHRLSGIDGLVDVLALRAPGVATPPPVADCPYRGLLPFEPSDADRYFGREHVVADVQQRLGPGRFVAVVGSSGSGKSSLLRAGVAPRWPGARVLTPGTAPPDSLGGDELLVVDQFEELFTIVAEGDRAAFVEALLGRPGPTVIALRADFYGECATVPALAEAVAADQLLLGPMLDDELRRAIEAPAEQAGLRLEPGLVDVLVAEVEGEPGGLPLLSHALLATWDRRDGRTLTLDGYRASGGVRGAIAASADRLLAELGDDDRQLARSILLRLIEPGEGAADTRRRARLDELRPQHVAPERIDRILGALAEARLVTLDEDAAELSHEALIREWPLLTSWLDEDRDRLRARRLLATAAAGWDTRGRDPSELLRGARLASAIDALADGVAGASRLELEFVAASEAEAGRVLAGERRARRRLRRLLVGVGAALVVALVAAGIAVASQRRADDARDEADAEALLAEARRVGTEALVVDDVDVSLLLAVEGYRLHPSGETAANLMAAIQSSPQALRVATTGGARLLRTEVIDGGRTLVTVDNQGTMRTVDAATLAERGRSPGGRQVLAHGFGDALVVDGFDEATDQPVLHLMGARDGKEFVIEDTVPVDGFVVDAALHPTRREVAVAVGSSEGGELQVIDLDSPEAPRITMPADLALGGSVTYSADGGRLAFMASGTTQVLDTSTGTRLSTIRGTFLPAVLSPDGHTLAAPPSDFAAEVALYDVATGATRAVLGAHTASVLGITFSPDSTRVATMGDDGEVLVWDTTTGGRRHTLAGHSGKVLDAAFAPDGETLYSVGLDSRIVAWDLSLERTLAGRRAPALGPDVAVPRPRVVGFDEDGAATFLVSADGPPDDLLQIIDRERGSPGRLLDTGHDDVTFAVWLDGGTELLTGGTDGHLRRWSAATGSLVADIDLGTTPSTVVGIDGGAVLVGDQGGTLHRLVLDTMDTTPVADVGRPIVALAAGGRDRVALLSAGGSSFGGDELAVVELGSGEVVWREDLDEGSSLAVARDGAVAAVGGFDGALTVFDLADGRRLGSVPSAHDGFVLSVDVSPDGSQIVTAGSDGRVSLWEAATRSRIAELAPGVLNIGAFARFVDDGASVVIGYEDGSVFAAPTRPDAWVDHACAVAGRNLTSEEWTDLFGDRPYRETCR